MVVNIYLFIHLFIYLLGIQDVVDVVTFITFVTKENIIKVNKVDAKFKIKSISDMHVKILSTINYFII